MIYETFVVSTLLYDIEHWMPLSRHWMYFDASKQSPVSPDYNSGIYTNS